MSDKNTLKAYGTAVSAVWACGGIALLTFATRLVIDATRSKN